MEKLQLKRDTAANWSANNPVLAAGEPAVELPAIPGQPCRMKLGDGSSTWSARPYFGEGIGGGATLAGNTFTGRQTAPAFSAPLTIGRTSASSTAGSYAIDLSAADYFEITLSGNSTLTTTNPPSLSGGESIAFVVRVKQGATAFSLAWFSGISWLTTGGTAPSAPDANKSKEFVFTTSNGTNFVGRVGSGT